MGRKEKTGKRTPDLLEEVPSFFFWSALVFNSFFLWLAEKTWFNFVFCVRPVYCLLWLSPFFVFVLSYVSRFESFCIAKSFFPQFCIIFVVGLLFFYVFCKLLEDARRRNQFHQMPAGTQTQIHLETHTDTSRRRHTFSSSCLLFAKKKVFAFFHLYFTPNCFGRSKIQIAEELSVALLSAFWAFYAELGTYAATAIHQIGSNRIVVD